MSNRVLMIAASGIVVLVVALAALTLGGKEPGQHDQPNQPPDPTATPGATKARGTSVSDHAPTDNRPAATPARTPLEEPVEGQASLTEVEVPGSKVDTTELEAFVRDNDWPQVGARTIAKACDTDPCVVGFEFDPSAEDFESWKAEMGRQGWDAADDDSQLSVAEQANGDQQQAWFYWVPDQMTGEQAQAFHQQIRSKLMVQGGPDIGE